MGGRAADGEPGVGGRRRWVLKEVGRSRQPCPAILDAATACARRPSTQERAGGAAGARAQNARLRLTNEKAPSLSQLEGTVAGRMHGRRHPHPHTHAARRPPETRKRTLTESAMAGGGAAGARHG